MCDQGHAVCKACSFEHTRKQIEDFCLQSQEQDPIQIAEQLMQLPNVPMHGPEHHFIVPAALLTAYYNHKGQAEEKASMLAKAKKRSSNVLGGFCGFYGTCGAAMGTGIFISLITGATPTSKNTWKECNRMTAESLLKISSFNGPRCCKRDSFLSIEQAIEYLKEELGTILPAKQAFCNYSDGNKDCIGEECKYNDQQIFVCNIRGVIKKQS
jgi:hypothetical protein